MKNISTLLFCLIFSALNATNYYLAATGNDANSGTSPASPWQNLSRLSLVTFAPGDSVLLNRGDTFRGSVNLNQSGTAAAHIVFASYGSGDKPIISGAELLTGWVQNGSRWEASVTATTYNFFVNDEEMTLARYPDNGFLYLNTATTGGLTDMDLNAWASGYWNGSQICVRTSQWSWEKTAVATHVGSQITYSTPLTLAALNGYGYFFYNKFEELNAADEWYLDSVANVLYYVPPGGQIPNDETCEITTRTAGIHLNGAVQYVDIYDIVFEKQRTAGILIAHGGARNFKIEGCEFYRQYHYGVQAKGRGHEISNCYFRSVDGDAINVSTGGATEIHHNTFRNIGRYRNSGVGGQSNLSAVKIAFGDSCHVHHNDIDSTGYTGISADGTYHVVEKNVAKHCMLLLNDGAPFKTFGVQSHHNVFRNNFASLSNGNTDGAPSGSFPTPGFYADWNSYNIVFENNTVHDQSPKGIFLNGGTHDCRVTGNVVYGSSYLIDMNGASQPTVIHDDTIMRNVFFALDPLSVVMRQSSPNGTFNFGILDSNYYFNPYSQNRLTLRIEGGTPVYRNLPTWQSATGNDPNTVASFVSWTLPTNLSQLFTNPTDSVATVDLGSTEYLDLDSNQVCGTLTLQPWTSQILIENASPALFYLDADGDGYGAGAPVNACQSPGVAHVSNDDDCDDANAAIHPGANEICNDLDDDCNGSPEGEFTTWTGSGDGLNWSDVANWSEGFAPLPCQNVVIPAGMTVKVAAGILGAGRALEVATGGQLEVENTATLTIGN